MIVRGAYRSWAVFSLALASLLGLMSIPSLTALRRSQVTYGEIRRMQENYERSQRILEDVASDAFLISLTVREFLLDTAEDAGPQYNRRLAQARERLERSVGALRGLMGPDDGGALDRLRREIRGYVDSVAHILSWTPRQRARQGTYFLREEQRPTRQSVLAVAEEIGRINTALYRAQTERVNRSEREFRESLRRTLWLVMLAGAVIAGASIVRIAILERRARMQHEQAERTGQEMRHLSARLRQAQEEERKSIARELHDEVGQKLTALRMGLGGMDRMRAAGDEAYRGHLDEMKGLAEQSLRSIRDIAAGLRPSVLDDLGLGPALQRHTREFTRHTGIPVAIELTGDLDALPDRHRTCIYRVVQESLTNCARHAKPRRIEVSVHGGSDAVELTVKDDGAGFDAAGAAHSGIGLIGMEERVKELGGELHIESAPGLGAKLRARLTRNGKDA